MKLNIIMQNKTHYTSIRQGNNTEQVGNSAFLSSDNIEKIHNRDKRFRYRMCNEIQSLENATRNKCAYVKAFVIFNSLRPSYAYVRW